ncbi:MAG: hypothetical protein U1G08_18515 [Verrucomicrobiota bacterium]
MSTSGFRPRTAAVGPGRAAAEGHSKATYRLSLANAVGVAAALAREKKAELVTGDPEFKAMEKEIRSAWLK